MSPFRFLHASRPGAFAAAGVLAVLINWLPWATPARAAPPALPGVTAADTPVASAAAAPAEAFTAEAIEAKRVALRKETAEAREELSKLTDAALEGSARWLTQETALLERIDAVYAEQQRTRQHATDLAKEAADVEERTRNPRPVETTLPPPHGMLLLDQLYGERDYLAQADGWLKTDLNNTEAALQDARDTLAEKDRARRAAREAANAPNAPADSLGTVRLAELESRLADETVFLRENALRTLRLQRSLIEPKQRLLRPRFDWLRAHLDLRPENPEAAQTRQQKRLGELDRAIVAARKDAEAVTQAVIVTERDPVAGKHAEELESRRASRQTANLTLSVLTAQRERLAEVAGIADLRRRVLAGGVEAGELRALAEANQEALDQLTRERRRVGLALRKSRQELQDGQSRLSRAAAADERPAPWNLERVRRLAAWIDLSERDLAEMDELLTARNRLKEEIGGHVNLFSWRDTVALASDNAVAAWNYEVFSVKDEPVRVKTILIALILVVLGYHVSRWLSEGIARTVFKRMGMNTGRSAAWQTLWFYGLFIGVLLTASNLFHISLTQFSVVSGALAVGIGFGSQNLVSNFISGIILLIERPVNQGDVIEIDGRQVTVERLGPRSTIVRTADNTHVIVPNNRLLEQPVTNWTLSDDIVRKCIRIGVAYGSPTRTVTTLLTTIVTELDGALQEPAGRVTFADFGENALVFEVAFWTSIAGGGDAENELRHRIAEVFTREGIVMAFPQRDVHLETTKPLQVVIASPDRDGPGQPPP